MKRKTKRLLAKLLALVMVLSLCEITLGQSTPAKAAVSLQNPTTDGNGVTTWQIISRRVRLQVITGRMAMPFILQRTPRRRRRF